MLWSISINQKLDLISPVLEHALYTNIEKLKSEYLTKIHIHA